MPQMVFQYLYIILYYTHTLTHTHTHNIDVQDTIDKTSKLIVNLDDIQRERLSKPPSLDSKGHYVLPPPSEQEIKTGLSCIHMCNCDPLLSLSLSLSLPSLQPLVSLHN